jgi:MGT family glycosyltransferase
MHAYHFCHFGKGHIFPTIPIARELLERGANVTSYGLPEDREIIGRSGATFRPYASPPEREFNAMQLAAFQTEWTVELLPGLLADVEREQPDVVITDSMLPLGWYVAHIAGLPLVVTTPHFVADERVTSALGISQREYLGAGDMGTYDQDQAIFERAAAQLHSQYDIAPLTARDTFQIPGDLTLVTTSRELQPHNELLDETYKFIGPIIEPRQDGPELPLDLNGEGALIYISLGTMAYDLTVFGTFPPAFEGTGYQVVISTGGQKVALDDLPHNVKLFDFVPQLALLPYVDVFVTHGGWNSVNESLYHDVPMVVYPQGKDQFMNAKIIHDLGAGIAPAQLTSDTLRAAVDEVHTSPSYRKRARELGATLRATGGAAGAAREIIALLDN